MCLVAQKQIAIIGGSIAAAAIIAVLIFYQGTSSVQVPISTGEKQDVPTESKVLQTYKINTECELIYGLSYGVYPDNQKIPPIIISELVEKYPDLGPWKDTLSNNETRKAFFSKPLPPEFSSILVTSVMDDASINPNLKDVAMILTDPQGIQKLREDFQKYECQPYFDSRANQ